MTKNEFEPKVGDVCYYRVTKNIVKRVKVYTVGIKYSLVTEFGDNYSYYVINVALYQTPEEAFNAED